MDFAVVERVDLRLRLFLNDARRKFELRLRLTLMVSTGRDSVSTMTNSCVDRYYAHIHCGQSQRPIISIGSVESRDVSQTEL